MRSIIIFPIYVVSMHRYGRSQLQVGCGFVIQPEPSNPFDSNALAVKDRFGGQVVGYVRRQDAAKLAPILAATTESSTS